MMQHAAARTPEQDLTTPVNQWLQSFNAALERRDAVAATALFTPDGHWRDVLAMTWHLYTASGSDQIRALLDDKLAAVRPANFRIDPQRTDPRWVSRAGQQALEALLAFDTAIGHGSGVLRLVPDAGARMRAWTLSTNLEELTGHEEHIGERRPTGPEGLRDFGAQNWLDQRRKTAEYSDRDPVVIVVGAGQAGLNIAARLGALGVDTLIVERNARIGDNWRKRYHSLTLHNEVFVNHFAYMPFPANWPVYISKDKLANWFEGYAEAMELNCWTNTEFVRGSYDDRAERWSMELRRADGTLRTLKPRHVLFAVGASPIASKPQLPGLQSFKGTVTHSEGYVTGTPWRGKRAFVLGTGTSGHDVAQDLHACGADVTLIQRSPTYVVSLKEGQRTYLIYREGVPYLDVDLIGTSMPYPLVYRSHQLAAAESRKQDAKLLKDLDAAGFRLEFLDGDPGYGPRYWNRGGGYYFNVGCSDLIIRGEVKLMQYSDVERFVPEGMQLKDGRSVPMDLLVLATGYKGQQEVARRLLGDAVADRIGPVWGISERGELRNMFVRTPQKGLWFIAGSLAQSRIYSKYLALQIKATEVGLMPLALPQGLA
jgi:cation diffusion facilitator CzcD-associated flavoprotein CzcO